MPASDALEVRTQVTAQLRNPLFRRLINKYAELEREEGLNPGNAEGFKADKMESGLTVAETYYVSPDMTSFATLAAESFPDDEAILKEDQPSGAGFMYLPARLRFLELRGRLQVVHAVLWVNHRIWAITDRLDPDDEISSQLRHELPETISKVGRWDVVATVEFGFGKPMPKFLSFPKSVLPPEAHVEFRRLGDGSMALHTDHPVGLSPDAPPVLQPSRLLTFMLATWRLMQQTLSSVERQTPPRAVRRRAERHRVPTGITVISLRRRDSQHVDTGLSINYRTIVRGHWRRVWCGPMDGERYQRAVYIHPFIRGPENAPLIIRERINALVR